MTAESPQARERRRRLRTTFDAVAGLYEASRRGYPDELVDLVVSTAGLDAGSPVLEIGCGTGQLTRSLVARGLDVTAIDLSPAMVDVASRSVPGGRVRFVASSFEDLDAPAGSFDLVASATAFHWLDPDVAHAKAASLLRDGGWLALLATGEDYDDPFGAALRAHWSSLAPPDVGGPAGDEVEAALASGRFDAPLVRTHAERIVLSPAEVAGVERTRATVLDYAPDLRRRYDDGLDALLAGLVELPLTQRTRLAMLRRAGAAGSGP